MLRGGHETYNAVRAEFGGTITAICLSSGDAVSEDDGINDDSIMNEIFQKLLYEMTAFSNIIAEPQFSCMP